MDVEEYVERVLQCVESVPRGRVTTYGAIAEVVGEVMGGGGPRQVGSIMASHGGAVTWWRVVRADGSLPPSHQGEARQAYLEEGTPLRPTGNVDIKTGVLAATGDGETCSLISDTVCALCQRADRQVTLAFPTVGVMTRTLSRGAALAAAAVLALTLAGPAVAPATASTPAPAASRTAVGWTKVHFHMNAYPEAGSGPHGAALGCDGTWSDSHGSCHARGEDLHSYPFNVYASWEWNHHRTHCPELPNRDHSVWTHELRLRSNAPGWPASQLCGWVDRQWGTFAITEGKIYTNSGWHDVATTSAVVADREHTRGGPLFVHLGHRSGGYVLGMRGWLHY